MSNQGVTNILTESFLTSFAQVVSGASGMKTMCIGKFNPLSRKECELLLVAFESVNKFQFVKQTNPVIIVPLDRKKFDNTSVWEAAMCGLSNHRLVDYVIDMERCSIVDIIDRVKPDFLFVNRSLPECFQIENFAKKLRIKLIKV